MLVVLMDIVMTSLAIRGLFTQFSGDCLHVHADQDYSPMKITHATRVVVAIWLFLMGLGMPACAKSAGEAELASGTLIVFMPCHDGVIAMADREVMHTFTPNGSETKITPIDPNTLLLIVGSPGLKTLDGQRYTFSVKCCIEQHLKKMRLLNCRSSLRGHMQELGNRVAADFYSQLLALSNKNVLLQNLHETNPAGELVGFFICHRNQLLHLVETDAVSIPDPDLPDRKPLTAPVELAVPWMPRVFGKRDLIEKDFANAGNPRLTEHFRIFASSRPGVDLVSTKEALSYCAEIIQIGHENGKKFIGDTVDAFLMSPVRPAEQRCSQQKCTTLFRRESIR